MKSGYGVLVSSEIMISGSGMGQVGWEERYFGIVVSEV
jgi:hypothetical protein